MTIQIVKRDSVFSKFDDENRIAYGWAIVSEENGKPYFDLQGDHIPMGPIISATVDFMKNSRVSDDMHTEIKTGEVVFCAPVMKGAVVDPQHPTRTGLWIGVQIHDEDTYQKTKKGERTGFSIGGMLDEADYISAKGATVGKQLTGEALTEMNGAFLKERSTKKSAKPTRVFRAFRLGFISTVDMPAMEGAQISVVKSAPKETVLWLRKGENPFASKDDEEDEDEEETDEKTGEKKPKKKPAGEGNPFAENKNANKPLVPGSTSALEASLNSDHRENKSMTTITIEKSEHESLLKRIERAEQIGKLTDGMKGYFGKLDADGQAKFLAKSATDRAAELKEQVAYESPITGDIYYKFDDERLVKNAKRADEMEKTSTQNESLAKRSGFAKKAGEIMKGYPHDPATPDVLTDIVGAIEIGITDPATKKAAFEVLAAGNNALLSKGSVGGHIPRNGDGGPTNANDPIGKARGELRGAVEAYQKANNIASYDLAFLQATGSDPKVRELYETVSDLADN